MKTVFLLVLALGLAGCRHKAADSAANSQTASGATAGKEQITGVPGFELGTSLSENANARAQADGSLLYVDGNYTNIPPFQYLYVFATSGRQIYSILLKSPPGVDPEVCGTLANSLAQKYGNRQDTNSIAGRAVSFGSGGRTGTLGMSYADHSAELSYSLSQTNR